MEFTNTQKALSLIIFVLITVAPLTEGILLCQDGEASEEKANTSEEKMLTAEEILTTKKTGASETASWKTFISHEYGFKLKYPPSFLISHKYSEITIYQQIIRIDNPEPFKEATKIKKGSLNFAVCFGNLDKCFKDIPERWELRSPPKEEKINGVIFYRLYLEEKEDTTSLRITYRTIYHNLAYEINLNIPGDPKIVREEWENIRYIHKEYKHEEDILLKQFNEILDTFAFLYEEKLTDNISDWEIYKDKKNRFEFRYPPDFQICAGEQIDTCNFGFRCDARPTWETLQMGDKLVKLKIPNSVFIPVSFKDINVISCRCGTMYFDKVAKLLCESFEEADKKGANTQESFYYYGPYDDYVDCDMQGCNRTAIYYLYQKNTCYRIILNFYSDSGLNKTGPPFGLLVLPADYERFENIFKLILSTFRTFE